MKFNCLATTLPKMQIFLVIVYMLGTSSELQVEMQCFV